MIIRYGAIGLGAGSIILLLCTLLLFTTHDLAFSFTFLRTLHRDTPLLFLADLLPLLGIMAGVLSANYRFRQLKRLRDHIGDEREKNQEIRRFTHALIAGDLNTSFAHKGSDEALSTSLNKLKDTLVRNRELERQRRLEEKKRNWGSEGLAEFGDLLRKHSRDHDSLANELLPALVRYLNANQGSMFLRRDDENGAYLEMIACYAYDRRKFPDKRIRWGSGLAGAVAMEKKSFYTDRIPEHYLDITSGLGKATPTYLVIEPLVWNDRVFGIIEIASFNAFDEHERQFIARVAENAATTLSTMESNLRTEQLLKETQAQAEQLARQEEQVRQNMNALKMAQEEAAKQAEIFISFTNTVNHTLMRAEYATDGTLLYANTRFLNRLGYSGNREVEGKHISMFIHEKDRTWFDSLWKKLSSGGRHYEGLMKHETKLGQDLWTMATYTCVRKESGEVEKILFLAIDSTGQKKESLAFESEIRAMDRLNARAVFSPGGKLLESNTLLAKVLKYEGTEMEKMNVFDFFTTGEQERFNEIWEKVIGGSAFQGQLKMKGKYGGELWFRASFLAATDMYGELEKVVFLASEISREKEMELASRNSHDQLIKKREEL